MDLTSFISSQKQVNEAVDLIRRGLFCYQPFKLTDRLEIGVGYEFFGGDEGSGLVSWPDAPKDWWDSAGLKRLLLKDNQTEKFAQGNQRLREMYDFFVDETCNALGDVSKYSFAEIGCNSGYFPISFLKKGVKEAYGFDREDYSDTFKFLNRALGTKAKFVQSSYDPKKQSVPDAKKYDIVYSVAVICHLSDPLQHLAYLGSISKKALFVWSLVTDKDDYSITFEKPNRYYEKDVFPFNFDSDVAPSRKLLVESFRSMGFKQIIEIKNPYVEVKNSIRRPTMAILGIRD